MKKTIQKIMIKDHNKISNLLEELIKSVDNDFEKSQKIFLELKWFLEKHFFVEEKVIFTVYIESEEESEDIFRLLKDHKDLLWFLERIEEDFRRNIKPKLFNFQKLLKAHASFENSFFYPKLEEELSDPEKRIIIDREEEIKRF